MSDPVREELLRQYLVGESRATRDLRAMIARLGPTSLPVWIEGETGVGKEQVALALHAASGRRGAFVAVNVCAISESMFEDAFFGHVRGAFTGARDATLGHFGEADEGTLFLDEISGLPVSAQVKLLRAVETQRYRQVGARTDRGSQFRLIAASNEPSDALLRSGRLRLDLAFRLRGSVLQVPPLRERIDDVDELVAHFRRGGHGITEGSIGVEAIGWLKQQPWHGNVRELRQVLQCARALAHSELILERDLKRACRMLSISAPDEVHQIEVSAEREELLALLRSCGWDTVKVASELSVDRTTVYRRMRRLAIDPTPRGSRRRRWRQSGASESPMHSG